ncbi:MAG: hypothetical protein KAT68_19005 [Bacteroidales bacterium]|nr:hypothetical protein [Bacteroidales bacterium]
MEVEMYNIAWLFIDGVRRYHTNDDRGRLDFMDKFAHDSVEFKNVVTSAPSTYMSISAMMSGLPSYYINRNYSDFIYEDNLIPSLRSILINHGYENYNFWMSKESRETMKGLLPVIEHKYWPKSYKHRQWWDNQRINDLLDYFLQNKEFNKPTFFFVDYNCREDPLTSDRVKWAYNKFKDYGFSEENTIYILCSDHGYPDPSKETGRPEYYRKNNLSHDLVLSDDNIMIPLLIQYPGCPKGKKIETTVGSIDIYPTIMDILGIDNKNEIHGNSLLPLISDSKEYQKMMESRFLRCDSRLSFQTGKGTAIRNSEFKYIYYQDKLRGGDQEKFFDIKNDELEKNNLINSENANIRKYLEIFRKLFQDCENDAINFQFNYLFDKFSGNHKIGIENAKEILITDSCNPIFIDMLVRMIKKLNKRITIYVLIVEHDKDNFRENIVPVYSRSNSWSRINVKAVRNKRFDIIFAPYNTSEQRNNISFKKNVKKMIAKKIFFLDYNMESFKKTIIGYYWKKFKISWSFMKYEPQYLIFWFSEYLMKGLIKNISDKYKNLKGVNSKTL